MLAAGDTGSSGESDGGSSGLGRLDELPGVEDEWRRRGMKQGRMGDWSNDG